MALSDKSMQQYQAEKDRIYLLCKNAGVPQDADILYHVDSLYRETGGKVEEYMKENWKREAAGFALRLGLMKRTEVRTFTSGRKADMSAAENIEANLSVDAHRNRYAQDDEEQLRQKILFRIDPSFREEKMAEYEGFILSIPGAPEAVS
jgi:hypothetical protein